MGQVLSHTPADLLLEKLTWGNHLSSWKPAWPMQQDPVSKGVILRWGQPMRQHIFHIAFGLAPTRVKIPERCHHRTSVFHNMGYKIRMMYVLSLSCIQTHPSAH